MSLDQWAKAGWLKKHKTSREEIKNLLTIVDRDINDATSSISNDWRFGIAYNAALKLCTILLYTEGYRASHSARHYRTIAAMPLILGESRKDDADYLERCRKKRNIIEYEYAGGASKTNADELLDFVEMFKNDVIGWLQKNRPDLLK